MSLVKFEGDVELISRLESVRSAQRRLPPGDGDVGGAAAQLLALARSALTDMVGSNGAVMQLETVTEVQAAETLAMRGMGKVKALDGKWTFWLWEETDE